MEPEPGLPLLQVKLREQWRKPQVHSLPSQLMQQPLRFRLLAAGQQLMEEEQKRTLQIQPRFLQQKQRLVQPQLPLRSL